MGVEPSRRYLGLKLISLRVWWPESSGDHSASSFRTKQTSLPAITVNQRQSTTPKLGVNLFLLAALTHARVVIKQKEHRQNLQAFFALSQARLSITVFTLCITIQGSVSHATNADGRISLRIVLFLTTFTALRSNRLFAASRRKFVK